MVNKQEIVHHFDKLAPYRRRWFYQNWLYHEQLLTMAHPFLHPDARVLEIGCSTGDLLHELNPAEGVGIDISPESIEIARQHYPNLRWIHADAENLPDLPDFQRPFDLIIISDLIGYLDDIQLFLEKIHMLTHPRTRIILSLWNWLWQPVLNLAETLQIKAPDLKVRQNWVSADLIITMLELAGYTTLQVNPGLLFPYHIPGVSPGLNSLSKAPIFNRLALLKTIVARPVEQKIPIPAPSISLIIPTRNEVGNIAPLIEQLPEMGSHTELIFVDGNSTDGTIEKIVEQIAAHPERDIKYLPQLQPHSAEADAPSNLMLRLGKGDAVRKGFDAASGDILLILDSDISVPPSEMPKFYHALASGEAQFVNGTRFVYPQEAGAMPLLNRFGNVFFSLLFSWLLDQRVSDTLCGTKGLYKKDYESIKANRSYFGDFDPFGDFDLLFGAAWLKHRILEVPVHYRARIFGTSKVRVGLHGPLLGRMSLIAFWQFKVRPLLRGSATRPVETQPASSGKPFLILVLAALLLALLRGWRSGA